MLYSFPTTSKKKSQDSDNRVSRIDVLQLTPCCQQVMSSIKNIILGRNHVKLSTMRNWQMQFWERGGSLNGLEFEGEDFYGSNNPVGPIELV